MPQANPYLTLDVPRVFSKLSYFIPTSRYIWISFVPTPHIAHIAHIAIHNKAAHSKILKKRNFRRHRERTFQVTNRDIRITAYLGLAPSLS